MSRAVAYLRVTDADPSNAQRSAIAAWAERQRIEVASWQVDVGIDGATPIAERPALLAAYAAIRTLRAKILVAADPTRFADDQFVSSLIEHAALTEGATLYTVAPAPAREEPTPNVGLTRGAVDLARAFHRVTARARIRASLAEKKARGERVGTVPYGYRLATDHVHIEPDAAEQAVVDTVRRLAREGRSQRAIAATLTADGVTGRTGAPLGQTQIAAILRRAG